MLSYSTGQYTASWTAISALATVAIAVPAMFFGWAQHQRGKLDQEREKLTHDQRVALAASEERERKVRARAEAVEKASALRVENHGATDSPTRIVRNAGAIPFEGVTIHRWDYGEPHEDGTRWVESIPPIPLGLMQPGVAVSVGVPHYFEIEYNDVAGRTFKLDDYGVPELIHDPADDPATEDRHVPDQTQYG